MLIKRQISILLEMSNQVGEYYKANHFSDKFNVSLRTVQNDLKAIKEETLMYKNDFIIESKVPFGTRIIVMHNEKFKQFINDLKLQSDEFNTNDRDDRIYKLLNFLLDQRKSISITKCADYIFVSKSTLMLDLKELETIISKYSLRLIQSKGYLWIDGLERDKRICLMDNNYAYLSVLPTNLITGSETGHISFIHNLLINELLHKQYPISDVEFQNLILWLNISIRRIGSFFYLNEEDINDDITHSVEIEIARNIFERIETKYLLRVPQTEINFLAMYINKSINDYAVLKGNKRLCIITNLKRSEYFLLEQLLYDQFRKYIADITFVSSQELEKIDLNAFDLFFSTEDNKATEVGLATKLTFFPDASELQKIKVRIEGFKNVEDIIRLFDPRLFFRAEIPAKEKVQKKLVKTASQLYQIENLYEEIELREEFGSTYFGNGVAILHPMHLITNESFIGEIVLKKPIPWDNDGNYVNLVFLVCIQKNNLEAFRAWDYLSPLLFNNQFKQEVLEVENYEHFKQVLEANLKSNIL